ncbi:MAG TPA: hypothetical protein VNG53_05475 [Bacteroidia bacterium]|nr:hypothetical protein [Bacteroidia bacterium]
MTRKINFLTASFLIFGVSATLFFSSCSNVSRHPNQVKYLDSLTTQLQQTQVNLQKIDTAKVRVDYNTLRKNLFILQQTYKDTMDSPTAVFLSGYRVIGRTFELFLVRDTLLQHQITKSITQLKSLSHDVQHNLIEENKVQKYCADECMNATELLQSASVSITNMNQNLPMFDLQNPKVEEIIKKHSSALNSKK